jgi:glycosyltransferase involved in cell wall biosynthesis
VTLQLLFVGNYLTTASRPVTVDLAAELERAGHRIRLTSSREAKLPRLLDMLATAGRSRAEYDAAVIDLYSGPAFLYAEAMASLLGRLGKPYVLTLHGGNLPSFARRWPRRVRRLLAGAARVTAPSAYLAEMMRPYRRDLQVIPNGLPTSRHAHTVRLRPAPRLVWLRAFHRIYAPVTAVETVARLVHEVPELHLDMIGPDKHDGSLDEVRASVDRLGLGAHVSLIGPVDKRDVPGRLQRADIFLNTATVDNTPVSVLEAMASGLCIVSTDAGGLSYLLHQEEDALLVPPNDSVKMAAAVRRILSEAGLGARLSANARRRAESADWSAVVPRWVELLESVVQRGGR